MEETPNANVKPVLQKPPGYRDPSAPPKGNLPIRAQPLPPSFRNLNGRRGKQRSRCSCLRKFCCWIFVFILILSFIVAIVGGLSYLWFQPKLPTFHLESVQFPKFNITSKSDASFLDSNAIVRIKIANPNPKFEISYAPIEVLVIIPGDGNVADTSLGSGTYPAHDLEKRNSTVIKIEAEVKEAAIDEILAKRLRSLFRSRNMKILVKLRTDLRVPKVPLTVLCGSLTLKQIDGGACPKCAISLFKWITMP